MASRMRGRAANSCGVALAIIEADGLDPVEARQRPGQADGGILAAGKQHQSLSFVMAGCLTHFVLKTHQTPLAKSR